MCFIAAIVLLFSYFAGSFERERRVILSDEEARRLSKRLSEALGLVRSLNGAALRRECKVIVGGLLVSVDFTLQQIREYYADHEPEEEDVLHCLGAILRSGQRLRFYLDRTQTLLRFWPLLSGASDRTLEAVRQYEELVALVQCCNSKLPDSASALPLLRLKPESTGN